MEINYPYFGLIVSGGHSLYLLVHSSSEFEILGTTRDDAAGEAFDKGSRVIGLGYPGGPAIEKSASKGDSNLINFPRPLIRSKEIEFSFSGLKTSLLYFMDSFKESKNYSVNITLTRLIEGGQTFIISYDNLYKYFSAAESQFQWM